MGKEKYTKEQAAQFYETMCTIRKFEETVKHDFLAGEIPGFTHVYIGEEAIATGVCAALRQDDVIASTHRGHGHCVAKGADVNRMMAEIFGKKTGLCQGQRCPLRISPLECWERTALLAAATIWQRVRLWQTRWC